MSEERGLQWAIQNGDINSVKEQLSKGASVNEIVKNRAPLHFAADYGQVEVLKLLLEKGADVNVKDKYDITPILAAIYEDHVECVKILLEKGASPDGKTLEGQSYDEVASDSVKKLLKEFK
ncbi:myotrophin-like [Mizuhopecten yessoensis]|uniref:Myotrophin n=1 Tax=Mizuhopecten yessoensis TaxID=6573 RepID=A0A210Q8B5_MIZYE|nr:myotrophin-like [Mizuhopecten yessoensis]OWF44955.1 Myotrophin [Mizuhopecten yessoensis]